MDIRLTRELLEKFIRNAAQKAEKTLNGDDEKFVLLPFAFGETAFLWYIPAKVSHPLRAIVGLSTPFILMTGYSTNPQEAEIQLQRVTAIRCGAEPLDTWSSLVSDPEKLGAVSGFSYQWGKQSLRPLQRSDARRLTAQYAQILPEFACDTADTVDRDSDEVDESVNKDHVDAFPMLALTNEAKEIQNAQPFYITVFKPTSDIEFANVVAVKCTGTHHPTDKIPLEQKHTYKCIQRYSLQHWAEYDLFGSPLQQADELYATSHSTAVDGNQEMTDSEELLVNLYGPSAVLASYATLHGIWTSSRPTKNQSTELPPIPSPSTQWILTLDSIPLTFDSERSQSLQTLYMEIKRLETWYQSWMNGSWWTNQNNNDNGQANENSYKLHPWQRKMQSFDIEDHSYDEESVTSQDQNINEYSTDDIENAKEDIDPTLESRKNIERLTKHREEFGKRIDEFIDASIFDTRGTTTLGRFGRSKDIVRNVAGFPIREDLDFTERLWNLSHHAYDSNDLSEMITAVAEGIETRKLQPYINRTNQSPLALLIRSALQLAQQKTLVDEEVERERLSAQLDMWIDEQPLDVFVHVGLHKLRSDFWFYFVNGQIATPKQLEQYLDLTMEPQLLIQRFYLLLRILEVWQLAKQAVPGLPRQFTGQIISALLDHFLPTLAKIDQEDIEINDDEVDGSLQTENDKRVPEYEDIIRIVLFCPLYSTEIQELTASICKGFDPTRYSVSIQVSQDTGDGSSFDKHQKTNRRKGDRDSDVEKRRRLVYLTKTPALVDNLFSNDNVDGANTDAFSDSSMDQFDSLEKYALFEADLF